MSISDGPIRQGRRRGGGRRCAGATARPRPRRAACMTALGPHTLHFHQCLRELTRYAECIPGDSLCYRNNLFNQLLVYDHVLNNNI